MSISTYGWGSGAITAFGFGASGIEYMLSLAAKPVCETDAYVGIATRDKGSIATRDKPASIPIRSDGWSD